MNGFEFLRERDVPIVTVMSNGYALDINDTVEIHRNTIQTVKKNFAKRQAHNTFV